MQTTNAEEPRAEAERAGRSESGLDPFPRSRLYAHAELRLLFIGNDFGLGILYMFWAVGLLCAGTMGILFLVNLEGNVMQGPLLFFIILFLATGGLIGLLGVMTMAIYFPGVAAWFLITIPSRARFHSILRRQGWPKVRLSPLLTHFPPKTWSRLPAYEDFLMTGWCGRWFQGEVTPLNLYAALALLEEWDNEPETSPVVTGAVERTDKVAQELLRKAKR